jgi:hypothetical protein
MAYDPEGPYWVELFRLETELRKMEVNLVASKVSEGDNEKSG